MATTEFIAAIEVASSHIAGMAGRLADDGVLQLLAYAGEPSSSFVRKGVVNNIDKTARALSRLVGELEAQTGCTIDKVYVGISGQPLHAVRNSVSRQFDGEQIISTELVDALCDENRECYPSGGEVEVLDVVPQEYRIDNQLLADPVSVPGRSITGQFLNLVSRTMLKERLELSFRQAGITLADDPVISPLALARAVLGEAEMRSGCVLVDFGADTTTVQVYKESILRHLAVIPLGGNSLTRDMATLQMEEADAEYLKLHQVDVSYNDSRDAAAAAADEARPAAEPMAQLPDGRRFPLALLCEAAAARLDEILANVNRQIELSGIPADMLFAGAILTGGASALPGLPEAFSRLCHLSRVKCVSQARIPLQAAPGLLPDAAAPLPCTLLGLLLSGRDNCCHPQPPQVQPVPDATGHTADIFRDDPDAQPQPAKPADPSTVKPSSKPSRPGKPGKPSKPGRTDEESADAPSSQGTRGSRSLFGDFFGRMAREMFSGDEEMKNN